MNQYDRADATLFFVAVLFAIPLWVNAQFPNNIWAEWFHFVADAALVGGIADWFAVTAIFRHPFGLKIPKTALLPSKRQAFIDGASDFVQKKLLNEKIILREIRDVNLLEIVSTAIRDEKNQQKAINYILDIVKDELAAANQNESAHKLARMFRQKLSEYGSKTLLSYGISWLKRDNNAAELLELVIPKVREKYIENFNFQQLYQNALDNYSSEGILSWIGAKVGAATGIVDVKEAADLTRKQLSIIADELCIRDSDLQRKFLYAVFDRAEVIINNQTLIRIVDTLRKNVVADMPLEEVFSDILNSLWQNFSSQRTQEKISQATIKALRSHIAEILGDQFRLLVDLLRMDNDLKSELNKFLKEIAKRTALDARGMTTEIITSVLSKKTDEEFNEIVKSKINKDLIFIRINGSAVGAIIGTCLFGVIQVVNLFVTH